ncbi:MAG: EcsC family protein [Geobacter sp.]|nr:EcsC family protein [Geobacter sp.]
MALSPAELSELKTAKDLLENPGLAARVSTLVGTPVELALKKLPSSFHGTIHTATQTAIEKALDVAVLTMKQDKQEPSSNLLHKLAAGASGAAGGFWGLTALPFELPLSTTIMLRSIADIARSEGEDLRQTDVRLECLQVLALGGASKSDDIAEAGYFAARAALAKAVSEAVEHLAKHGLTQQGAPAIVRLISQIAARFSIIVSEKVAAQAVPVVGALGGAAINTLFINHYQDMGRGHFMVRRLERLHGPEEIRQLYTGL